jgi:hypothetical protein
LQGFRVSKYPGEGQQLWNLETFSSALPAIEFVGNSGSDFIEEISQGRVRE